MSTEDDRVFHLTRAEQCRKMAKEANDPAVRGLHEQLARFHEVEARRQPGELATADDQDR